MFYVYFRVSSMTLPSFGSSPGACRLTSPRSLVTSRIVATMASARPAGADSTSQLQRHAVLPARLVDHEPRALRSPGGACRMSATCAGCTNMPFHLGRLVGAAHPALDAHVGAAARAGSRQHRRQVAGGEADQRVVGVEAGDDHFADLARPAPGRRCRGARSRAGSPRRPSCPRTPCHRACAIRRRSARGRRWRRTAITNHAPLGHRGPERRRQVLRTDHAPCWRQEISAFSSSAFSTISLRNEGVPT